MKNKLTWEMFLKDGAIYMVHATIFAFILLLLIHEKNLITQFILGMFLAIWIMLIVEFK